LIIHAILLADWGLSSSVNVRTIARLQNANHVVTRPKIIRYLLVHSGMNSLGLRGITTTCFSAFARITGCVLDMQYIQTIISNNNAQIKWGFTIMIINYKQIIECLVNSKQNINIRNNRRKIHTTIVTLKCVAIVNSCN